jgi:hypothetical protein
MNKLRFGLLGLLFVSMLGIAAAATRAADQKPVSGEDFFVISSIDRSKHVLVLLQPTEVTEAMTFTDKTQFFDSNGKPLKITDFRAGQTVYITSQKASDGSVTANRVRKGYMTVSELRRRYVPSLPASAVAQSSKGSPSA